MNPAFEKELAHTQKRKREEKVIAMCVGLTDDGRYDTDDCWGL